MPSMQRKESVLKERKSGIFLLFFAVLVIIGVSLDSHQAESRNKQSLASEDKASDESRILGEENNNPEEIIPDVIEEDSSPKETEASEEKSIPDSKNSVQDNLKNSLKKYCDKSGSNNKKKCKNYCLKARNKAGNKDLHKKYCEGGDDGKEKTNVAAAKAALVLEFSVNSGNGTEKFNIEFEEGNTVYELMKEAKTQGKLSYEKNTDETYGVYINEINGLKEGSDADWTKNKYWILYVNGKSSSLGCSNHKLNRSDASIEWKYEKYSF